MSTIRLYLVPVLYSSDQLPLLTVFVKFGKLSNCCCAASADKWVLGHIVSVSLGLFDPEGPPFSLRIL
jgi:hypothetical protein